MHWLARDSSVTALTLAGMLLLLALLLFAGLPVVTAGTDQRVAEPVRGPAMIEQPTPTEDATVTALTKEKLAQEVQQLRIQNDLSFWSWLRTNAAVLLSTLVVVGGALIGLFRWIQDRQDAREKQDEERFQSAVTALGSETLGAKIGAAVILRTFLQSSYGRFYGQVFDLTVANLRLPNCGLSPQAEAHPLLHLLTTVFREAYVAARDGLHTRPEYLNATDVQLITAKLPSADLRRCWMAGAKLMEADLNGAQLDAANLSRANMTSAQLEQAVLIGADLTEAVLIGAHLERADLTGADLTGADLTGAVLTRTVMHGVQGLTEQQRIACTNAGAMFESSQQRPQT
jgi:uncharacterized protein YjbI with pentapeptide repeats